jgi:hypothetical protein
MQNFAKPRIHIEPISVLGLIGAIVSMEEIPEVDKQRVLGWRRYGIR